MLRALLSPETRTGLKAFSERLGAWPQRIRRGPAAGLRVVAPLGRRRAYVHALHEPHVVEALCRYAHPGMAVADLGAYLGYMTLVLAARVGPTGRVFAFEPHPTSARRLYRSLRSNALGQVSLERVALAAESGLETLRVPANASMASLGPGGRAVRVTSLDAWREERSPPSLGLLKLDLEGGELAALEGARRTLANDAPVLVCEVHWGREVPYAPEQLVDWLCAAGYGVRLLPRLGRKGDDLESLLGRLRGCEPPAAMRAFHVLGLPG